jgi:predicted ABC-type ATPase
VKEGGHFVPADDIRRRFERAKANLRPYIETVDRVIIFDNCSRARLVGEFCQGREVARAPSSIWEVLDT